MTVIYRYITPTNVAYILWGNSCSCLQPCTQITGAPSVLSHLYLCCQIATLNPVISPGWKTSALTQWLHTTEISDPALISIIILSINTWLPKLLIYSISICSPANKVSVHLEWSQLKSSSTPPFELRSLVCLCLVLLCLAHASTERKWLKPKTGCYLRMNWVYCVLQ